MKKWIALLKVKVTAKVKKKSSLVFDRMISSEPPNSLLPD